MLVLGLNGDVPVTSTITATDQQAITDAEKVVAALATLRNGEAVVSGVGMSRGEEAKQVEAGDVRELFHSPILGRITLCL